MLEISPVLAGTFDTPDYTPVANNVVRNAPDTQPTSPSQSIDPRRYSQFDRTATEAGEMTNFSFSDVLDMVNPLQHIPVVSSIYRSITGDSINPVSRIAGDILYGGILGAASAIIGGIGAAGDAVVEAQTGKDSTGYIMAALFGPDENPSSIQLAQNKQATPDVSSASALIPVLPTTQQLAIAPPDASKPAITLASAIDSSSSSSTTTAPSAAAATPAKGFPLNRNKLPYGGVMDPSAYQAQNAAIALAEGSHAMRLGQTIYTSPLMNGPHPLPIASSSRPPGNTVTAATSPNTATIPAANPLASIATVGTDLQKNSLPQNLIDDMVMMKALNQYKGLAAGPTNLGTNLDVVN